MIAYTTKSFFLCFFLLNFHLTVLYLNDFTLREHLFYDNFPFLTLGAYRLKYIQIYRTMRYKTTPFFFCSLATAYVFNVVTDLLSSSVCVCVCHNLRFSVYWTNCATHTNTRELARTVRGNDLVCYIFQFIFQFNLSGELPHLHDQNGSQNLNKCARCQKGSGSERGPPMFVKGLFFFVICLKQVARFKFEISSTKLSFLLVLSEINDQNFEQVWSPSVDPSRVTPCAARSCHFLIIVDFSFVFFLEFDFPHALFPLFQVAWVSNVLPWWPRGPRYADGVLIVCASRFQRIYRMQMIFQIVRKRFSRLHRECGSTQYCPLIDQLLLLVFIFLVIFFCFLFRRVS